MRKQQQNTPHHIANIAHLFFAEESAVPECNIVVSFSRGELGEYVCQQLNRECDVDLWQCSDGAALQKPEASPTEVRRRRLIMCLQESEVGDCEVALKVGRVLGIMDPLHLQVLVFSSCGSSASIPAHQASQAALLTWCGELTRSLAGRCPVTITLMPDGYSAQSGADANPILKSIARRNSV